MHSFIILILFFLCCSTASSQQSNTNSLPYRFVPQHSILSGENLVMAGRIDLAMNEDVKEGEENIIGRYRAAILCFDKNFKKKWECIFSEYGYRSQISSFQKYNDTSFLVMMMERETKYSDRMLTLILISKNGKQISRADLCNKVHTIDEKSVWIQQKCRKVEHGYMKVFGRDSIVVAYTYRIGSGKENLCMNIEMYNHKFEKTDSSATLIGEIGNGDAISDIYAEPHRILIAADFGKNQLYNVALYETDKKLKIINKRYYFTSNDEPNVIVKNGQEGYILGCSVGNREKNVSAGLLFLDKSLDTTRFVQWGKYDQDDVMGIHNFNKSLLVAHESGELVKYPRTEVTTFRSGFSVFDLKGNLIQTHQFFKDKQEEITVGILPFKNGFYFVSRRKEGGGTIIRTFDTDYKMIKEIELTYVP
ncbi:MAG TPA: hypothetical protein VK177_11465 [Flavobacteriales bacterium]|nr:hypothetical protein [Flavobacteriales bacterium]